MSSSVEIPFPIQNFIGGVQYRIGGDPIVITAYRNPITDTLLFYAGIRDPGSGQIWEGVLANGVSGLGSWGTPASGFYASTGYQYITGTNVETNSRFDATVGSYWRIVSKPTGSLTIGVNFSGMHYDKNLRYFRLGQAVTSVHKATCCLTCPYTGKEVVSRGRCNTGLQSIRRSFKSQRFSRPLIETQSDFVQVRLRVAG